MSNSEVIAIRDDIKKQLDEGLAKRQYAEMSSFIDEIVFSDSAFVYKKIIVKWMRYAHILLEIATTEQNQGRAETIADRYTCDEAFETLVRRLKFALRRVLFGFSEEEKQYILRLTDSYSLSPEAIAIVAKGAAPQTMVAALIEQTAEVFMRAGREDYANTLSAYAAWFRSCTPVNTALPAYAKGKSGGLEVINLDATADTPENKVTDENAIAYIMCTNSKEYVDEAALYIARQLVPEGYSLKLYVVWNSKGMCQGYNYAMKRIAAKYKVYIHHDLFLADTMFTMRLTDELGADHYQMLGIAGTRRLPANGAWADSADEDVYAALFQDLAMNTIESRIDADENSSDIECMDGIMMATNTDIPWREDLYRGYHFYDASQCREFIRAGKKLGFFRNGGVTGALHEVSVNNDESFWEAFEEAKAIYLSDDK